MSKEKSLEQEAMADCFWKSVPAAFKNPRSVSYTGA